jgi:hypothetical protein
MPSFRVIESGNGEGTASAELYLRELICHLLGGDSRHHY